MENMEENFPTKFDKNAKYLLFLIIMNEIALWPIYAINGVSHMIQSKRVETSFISTLSKRVLNFSLLCV